MSGQSLLNETKDETLATFCFPHGSVNKVSGGSCLRTRVVSSNPGSPEPLRCESRQGCAGLRRLKFLKEN